MLQFHYKQKERWSKMTTFERILKAQQEQRLIQREKDKKVIESMFSNNPRPLNNSYLLGKVDK
jgi:hypothetical protein